MKSVIRNILIGFILLGGFSTHAATYTWTGNGFMDNQDYLWSNPFNWAELGAPTSGEANVLLVFPGTSAHRHTTNDIPNLTVASITFGAPNYVIAGKPATNALTLQANPFFSVTTDSAASNCQIYASCPLILGNHGIISVGGSHTLRVFSAISGPGGFSKAGTGSLRMAAATANSYEGQTIVSRGALELSNGISFPFESNFVSVPGLLHISGDTGTVATVRLFRAGQINASSTVKVFERGVLDMNGHNTAIGNLEMRGGRIHTASGSPGVLTLTGNVTNLLSAVTNRATISGRIHLGNESPVFDVKTSSRLLINASITGGVNVGFAKIGLGVLELANATNTYSGTTQLNEGAIQITGNHQLLGDTSSATVVAPESQFQMINVSGMQETLILNGGNLASWIYQGTNTWSGAVLLNNVSSVRGWNTIDEHVLTINGSMSGLGGLRVSGMGKLHIAGPANNTFTGGLFADEGFTYLDKPGGAFATAGSLTVGREDVMGLEAFVFMTEPHQVGGNSTVTILNSGALTINSGATQVLSRIEMAGGILASENNALTLDGVLTNRVALNYSTIGGSMLLAPGLQYFDGELTSLLHVLGTINGPGGIKHSTQGMIYLHNTNNYHGETIIEAGILRLLGNGRPGSTNAGTTISGLAHLQLYGVSITNETLVLKQVSAYQPFLTFATSNTWKGPVLLNGGTRMDPSNNAYLEVDGPILGTGDIHYAEASWSDGESVLVMSGAANSYTGTVYFNAGTLRLRKSAGNSAISGNLVIGSPGTGQPPAIVRCDANGQFATAVGDALTNRHVTVNRSGGFYLNGFNQRIANLTLNDGDVFTEGGLLSIDRDIQVGGFGNGASTIYGSVRFLSAPSVAHQFDISPTGALWMFAEVSETGTGELWKTGAGSMSLMSSNNFNAPFSILEGEVYSLGSHAFGTTNNPTIIENGGNVTILNYAGTEPFVISGNGFNDTGALRSIGTNVIFATVTLGDSAAINCPTNAALTIHGPVNGSGDLSKTGRGILRFAGTNHNTFGGAMMVLEGTLELSKTNATAIPYALDIVGPMHETPNTVLWKNSNQIGDLAVLTLNEYGFANLNGFSDIIGSLHGNGVVNLGNGILNTGGDGSSSVFNGVISGVNGSLTKTGGGTFTLTRDNTYTGMTTINGGKLVVNGFQMDSAVSLLTGGTLGGTGRVGNISGLNGHIAPGNSVGKIAVGNLQIFDPDGELQIEINGPNAGTGHDQIVVNGNILLMGGKLNIAMNTPGAIDNEYVIVRNDSGNPITGTLPGLPEGTIFDIDGIDFQISYIGGDGNDLVLIQKSSGVELQINAVHMMPSGQIQFAVNASPNANYRVEASTNLLGSQTWSAIATNVPANGEGLLNYVDSGATNHLIRYYRFVGE